MSNGNTTSFDCLSCDLVGSYEGIALNFVSHLSEAMIPSLNLLFISAATLWIVIQGFRLVMAATHPLELFRQFVIIALAHGILFTEYEQGLFKLLFVTTLELATNAAAFILNTAWSASNIDSQAAFSQWQVKDPNLPGEAPRLMHLMARTEQGFLSVMRTAATLAEVTKWYQFHNWGYIALLLLPYGLMLIMYLGHIIIAVLRVMIISAFMPILIIFIGFNFFRDKAINAFAGLLSSILILFGATLGVALIMFAVSSLDLRTLEEADIGTVTFWSKDYMAAMLLGWIGPVVLAETVGIANSITGSVFSNTSLGIWTAGVSGTLMKGAQLGSRGLSAGGKVAGKGVGGAAGALAQAAAGSPERVAELMAKYKGQTGSAGSSGGTGSSAPSVSSSSSGGSGSSPAPKSATPPKPAGKPAGASAPKAKPMPKPKLNLPKGK